MLYVQNDTLSEELISDVLRWNEETKAWDEVHELATESA